MTNLPFLLLALALALLGTHTTAHMQLTYPPPLKSKSNPNTTPANIDYSMTSPLKTDGSDFPCKGYLPLRNTPQGQAVASWSAGGRYNFTVSGGAPHGGGSCQAALSVDGGATFRVVHSYEGGCPLLQGDSSFGFAVPADTPGVRGAVFAWTWFNRLGNREMYMNCAVVDIVAGGGRGRVKVAFADRPGLFRANIGNGCRTVESADVRFPDPGPDVDGGGGATAPVGSCGGSAAGSGSEGGSGGSEGSGGGSEGGSGEGSTLTLASPSSQSLSYSPTGCQAALHHTATCTSTPASDPASGWTPGNDWPDWFRSEAPQPTGWVFLAVLLWVLSFTYHLL